MPEAAWQSRFPKSKKPAYEELLAFLPDTVRPLFLCFNDEMNRAYQVYNRWHRYETNAGWVYGYCRNYRCELLALSVGDGCFRVLGVDVADEASLRRALQNAKTLYDNGYEDRYARLAAEKKAGQIQRSKARVAREKEQMIKVMEGIDPDKLNRFKWAPKASRRKLLQLYRGEAQGLTDDALLDDVGYAFYARCQQARVARGLMDEGKLLCHHCGTVLTPGSYTAAVRCSCGHCYTYREYRRSCNAANIPGGRATSIFHAFADKWPGCRDSKEKMLLIDWLVHECHVTVMSGERGRSVCVNLIEGTLAQLRELLETLAGH